MQIPERRHLTKFLENQSSIRFPKKNENDTQDLFESVCTHTHTLTHSLTHTHTQSASDAWFNDSLATRDVQMREAVHMGE